MESLTTERRDELAPGWAGSTLGGDEGEWVPEVGLGEVDAL